MASGGKHRAKGVCNGFDWDDTALIEAYDRAMNQVKLKCEGETSKKNSSKEQKQRKIKWKVDDFCRALYKEDGSFYEAQIISINEEEDLCTVMFLGYENEEELELSQLSRSYGKLSRKKQMSDSKKSNYQNESFNEDSTSVCSDRNSTSSEKKRHSRNTSKNRHHMHSNHSRGDASFSQNFPVPPICPPFPCGSVAPQMNMPPPPMPFFPMKEVTSENALASMLMSWYMAGYHTGVHQGMQIGQRDTHCSSNRCAHSCSHDRPY